MVIKVQVMSDEEAERYNKWQQELDDTCDKIKFYLCLCLCIFIWVYMIIMIILSTVHLKEIDEYYSDKSNDLIIENGSQSR